VASHSLLHLKLPNYIQSISKNLKKNKRGARGSAAEEETNEAKKPFYSVSSLGNMVDTKSKVDKDKEEPDHVY